MINEPKGWSVECDFEEKAFFCKLTNHWHPVNGYITNPHQEMWLADEFIKEVK